MKRYILLLVLFIQTFQKSDVYFTKEITPEKIVEMFKKLDVKLEGNVGLKVHTGEQEGPYFLRPKFLEKIYDHTNGTFIECNTAYLSGQRHLTNLHRETLEINGWTKYRHVLMDENDGTDLKLDVENPHNISVNYVGEHLNKFDSCLVLAHFKGHPMGGFGGAMKQLSIGFASRAGKAYIHSGGTTLNYSQCWSQKATQLDFTAAMADAASTIVKYFKQRKGIVYINVLANISKVCDCGGKAAPPPKIRDIGILASTDPIAIDKACYDLIVKEDTDGSKDWVNQAETLLGLNTLKVGEQLGLGSMDYKLIDVDKDLWYVYYIIIPLVSVILIAIIVIAIVIYIKKRKSVPPPLPEKAGEDDGLLGDAVISKAE
jgi:uncharacterized Fe-S center protein